MTYSRSFILLLSFELFFTLGCVSVPEKTQPNAKKAYPQYWLTTSLYVGPFWGDDQLSLVDYRPFSTIDDVATVDGAHVYKPKCEGTIPAGTLVWILEINYPGDKNSGARPLYSPKDQVWVVLRIAKERGRVTIFRKNKHLLVLPHTVTTEKQVRGFLTRLLSPDDPNRWILQLESYIQDAIFEKRPVIGMKRPHLLAALGPALKKQFKKDDGFHDAEEIWHYSNYLIVITNDKVSRVKNLEAVVQKNSPKKNPL